MEKEIKLSYGIKSKLISATAMLLVAVIMVVSSTYAWFTLSTAPEVKSISTAVGANGALEIVLNTGTIKTGVLGSAANTKAENEYWGNLLDMSYADYGANLIVLQPSILNVTAENKINSGAPVLIPDYNAGGRVTKTEGAGEFGTINDNLTSFFASNSTGFRGLGVASGRTDRQNAFRNSLAEIASEQGKSLVAARDSLSHIHSYAEPTTEGGEQTPINNGATLGGIVVKKALDGDAAKFTAKEIEVIGDMISRLETSLKSIETAYIRALAVSVLSKANTANDETAIAAANRILSHIGTADVINNAAAGTRLNAVLTDPELASANLSNYIGNLKGYNKADDSDTSGNYVQALAALNSAKEAYAPLKTALETQTEFAWSEFSGALNHLMKTDNVTVNGMTVDQIRAEGGKDKIAEDVMGGKGITVVIPTGGGIYADIADLCEDYTVDIKIDTSGFGVGVSMYFDAKMKADSTADSKYLDTLRTALSAQEPESGTGTALPLTEFYGYALDLGFKTNASQSNLLLQYEAMDRIYSGKTSGTTMGGGSTMTFASTVASFNTDMVKGLMREIRVVFFDTNDYTILAEARLDVDNATIGNDGVTAYLKIVKKDVWTYNNETLYSKTENDVTTYYTDEAKTTAYSGAVDPSQLKVVFAGQTDAVITGLNQNVAHMISALVYLDGTNIGNEDVAATADDYKSLTGTVNLQFASSAELVPMQYGDLVNE